MFKVAPSILSADFSKLGEEIQEVEKSGVSIIHIDVMDGNFVPNISLGFPIIKSIRELTNMEFDVHLMIENPLRYIDEAINVGADIITIHYEADKHIDRTINYIKSKGKKVGIAINPATPVEVLYDLLGLVDIILVMTVNPGFGNQCFITYTLDKIEKLEKKRTNGNYNYKIQVDGGINEVNYSLVLDVGANILVVGSAIFNKYNTINNNIEKFI